MTYKTYDLTSEEWLRREQVYRISEIQDFIDSHEWLTPGAVGRLYHISNHTLTHSLELSLTPGIRIGGHWYVSTKVIEAGIGLGFKPAKRAPVSKVDKDQASFLQLVDGAGSADGDTRLLGDVGVI